jgi:hypothetical protein
MRFVAMAECGTHMLCFAQPGPWRVSERALAEAVIEHADASMLVLADRNFYSLAFWQRSCATGAKLLFRVRNDQRLPREVELPDGSYLSTLYPTEKARRQRMEGVRVRVIEYALDGIEEAEPLYRLITNWLEPDAAPAAELAAIYHLKLGLADIFPVDEVRRVVIGTKCLVIDHDAAEARDYAQPRTPGSASGHWTDPTAAACQTGEQPQHR